MKSFFMSILCTGLLLCAHAQDPAYPPAPAAPQNIIAAEYFVDTDPGTGSATAIAVTPGLAITGIPASINITGLANGIHRLFVRTKNAQGYWSIASMKDFLYDFNPVYPPLAAAAQNVIAAEYFIDTDPGFGSATAITVTPGIDLSTIPVAVNTAAVSKGTHRLYIRSKNNEGRWAMCSMKEFLIDFNFAYPAAPAAPQNMITAEYFIDTDPGFGNATALSFTPGVNLASQPAVINTAVLTAGNHRLFIRSKNNEGAWSITTIKEFITDFNTPYMASPALPQNIIAAEYFINTDPGFGNGTAIPITPGLDLQNIPVVVNTASLAPSTTNRLYLRTKNNEGRWSIANRKEFVVSITNDPAYSATPVAPQNIVAAEYFINNDPGIGNGTPINIAAALDINNIAVAVNTSSLVAATTNRLYLRTKNNEGRWSIANRKEFVVTIANDPPYTTVADAAQNIVAAEYFVNTDPGIGNGTPINIAAALNISNIAAAINTSSLSPATTNHLFLRTKDLTGKWSIANVKEFVVDITSDPVYTTAPATSQNITAAEYFIDTDPGPGAGIAITLTPASNINNLLVNVNTTGLTNGLHHLFIRSKSADGKWSITNSASFFTDLLALSADSLVYGNVPVNTTLSKDLVITNNSNANQTINAVVLSAPFSSNFTGVRTIAAGKKDTIRVDFTPTVSNTLTQSLQLQTSAGNYNVGLKGTGVTQVPSWTISPATGYNYGNIPFGTAFNVAINIQNTGNVPITLGNVTTTNAAFVPSFATGTVIPVNGNLNIYVLFTPTQVQAYNALLKIESSTPGVNFVTAVLSGNGFNPGTPPVLQFVTGTPYNASTGVNPAAGQAGDFTYKILYKSSSNRAPQAGSPNLSVDLNGDHDFTDLNEGTFTMVKETAGSDYVTGIVYAYTFTHNSNTSTAGYLFAATDNNGNAATTIPNYVSGPVVTNQQLDLRIFANDITFSKNNPAPGETFTMFARVSNSTALPATNIPVKFYRDTILIGSDIIPAVNAFSSATISRTLSFGADGFFPIKVWIDSSNTKGDINPLNNYAIRPVIVGKPNLPGGITVNTNTSVQQCPQLKVSISGYANYYGTGSPAAVAGAEVTINTGTQLITTTTNANGYYSYLLTGVTCGSSLTYTVSITDFTFTSSLLTNSISLPCPAPNACAPAVSMGGASLASSSSPCANIVGSNGTLSIHLKYRERNLANFWNAFDEIIKDTLKIFQNGVLYQTLPSADYSHGPGNEVTIPVSFPVTSTTPVVYSAELSYVYVEYLQIPSSLYHGNHIPMLQNGSTTITPVASLPDLTIQNFASSSFTSFSFSNANIKCVAAGAHNVKVYDSIPGGTITLIDTKHLSSLAAGTAFGISYSDPSISSGTHIIKIVTDADATVAETDEANNVFYFTIVVPQSELSLEKIVASPTALIIGSSTRFTATIKNSGRTTGSFSVRFKVNGIQVGALKTVVSLREGSSIEVVSDLYTVTTESKDCGVPVEAIADAGGVVTELNKFNNTRVEKFGTDLSPYQLNSEVGSASNPAVVRVFTTNQFFPAVRNIGLRDAADVTVRFMIGSEWIGADTIGNVKAGEIYAAHASFSHLFTTAGNYVVKVTSDTANAICENLESNNIGDFHIRVVDSKPDLEVLSQYISPSSLNPNIGQQIKLVGTVKNMGGKISTPSVLRFLVDDIQLGADVPVNGILPGKDTTVAATADYSSIIPGVKIMKIIVDPANTLIEEREDNNEATRTMIVGDAPDMARSAAGAISFNPAGFVTGDSVTVNFSIKNLGPNDGTAWVKFSIKDTTYATTAIDSMPFSLISGGSLTVSKRMLFAIDEGYVIAEIYNSNPMEFDLLNNNDTLRFTTVTKLKQAITINGNLDMKQAAPSLLPDWIGGKIMLGDYDLTVNGTVKNFDTAHFIITNGKGKLKMVNINNENVFPIGAAEYKPNFAKLTNTGSPDNFSVRVLPYLLSQGNSGDTVRTGVVNRTWLIDEQTPGGSNVQLSLSWNSKDELPGFERLASRTAHYTTAWQLGDLGAALVDSVGLYSRSQTGYTSFSPFIVTNSLTGILPLTLLQFTAERQGNNALLKWQTTEEINTARFELQHSTDGSSFNSISVLAAHNKPGVNDYRFVHETPGNGVNYYRLKMIDADGKFTYSAIRAITMDITQTMQLYPNPVHQFVTVKGLEANGTIEVLNAEGKLVKHLLTSGTSISIDLGNLSKGIYILSYKNKQITEQQKVIKD